MSIQISQGIHRWQDQGLHGLWAVPYKGQPQRWEELIGVSRSDTSTARTQAQHYLVSPTTLPRALSQLEPSAPAAGVKKGFPL